MADRELNAADAGAALSKVLRKTLMPRGVYDRKPLTFDPSFVPFEPGRSIGHVVDRATGCWDFVGKLDRKGYGQMHLGRRGDPTQRAHRVYYERLHGELPETTQLDHTCRNRRCVNPAHLEPVTNAVNAQRAERTVLTEGLVEQLRAEYGAGGVTFAALAKRHGVAKATVQHAVTRRHWKNVR